MRILLPLLFLLITACTGDATRVRIVNNTSFNLEEVTFSFGGEETELSLVRAGDESRYFRFDGADDCQREFIGQLQSFGEVESGFWNCVQPEPITPGKYSLLLEFSEVFFADGTVENGVFLRLQED